MSISARWTYDPIAGTTTLVASQGIAGVAWVGGRLRFTTQQPTDPRDVATLSLDGTHKSTNAPTATIKVEAGNAVSVEFLDGRTQTQAGGSFVVTGAPSGVADITPPGGP